MLNHFMINPPPFSAIPGATPSDPTDVHLAWRTPVVRWLREQFKDDPEVEQGIRKHLSNKPWSRGDKGYTMPVTPAQRKGLV